MRSALPILGLVGALLTTPSALSQNPGPDVIVGDLHEVLSYGSSGGVHAYAVGTVSCNIGTAPLNWYSATNQHPVIGQNVYRYFPGNPSLGQWGRFEQLGMSWLKHGFFALTQSLCNPCQNPNSGGATLGVGCSDPYSASLNGNQTNLGPRYDVNAFTGAYTFPYPISPTGNATLAGRIQVQGTDMSTASWPGSSFFIEGQYVTPDDAAAVNHFNNVSYRPLNITQGTYVWNVAGSTQRQKPAIYAWKDMDPGVTIQAIDVPGEGRFYIGYKATPLTGGNFHHEYALFNMNSDRAAGSLAVTLPTGVTATNAGFRDVNYHSGEPWVGTDWTITNTAGTSVSWACQTQAQNANANALRWGTMYNFRFDAPVAHLGAVNLGLWKAGTPASVAVTICESPNLPQTMTGGGYTLLPAVSTPYAFVQTIGDPGVIAGPTGDDASMNVALPFPFLFYDRWLNEITVSTNGYLCATDQNGAEFNNAAIPNAGAPNRLIAVYWDDLVVGGAANPGGQIDMLTTGTAPNRKFVVRWRNVRRSPSPTTTEDHQVHLEEFTGAIYITCTSTGHGGVSATRGIENGTGSGGLQISHNTTGSATNLTTRKLEMTTFPSVPQSAQLTFTGYGFISDVFRWRILSDPNSMVTLFADVANGPTTFNPYGTLNLGMSIFTIAIADATGLFGPATPWATTNSCNEFNMYFTVPPTGIPQGLTLYFQGLVWSPLAPNNYAHITTPAVLTT